MSRALERDQLTTLIPGHHRPQYSELHSPAFPDHTDAATVTRAHQMLIGTSEGLQYRFLHRKQAS